LELDSILQILSQIELESQAYESNSFEKLKGTLLAKIPCKNINAN